MIRNIRNLVTLLLAVFAMSAFAADANRASQAELETVKGIGPGLSSKILEARKASEFKNWGDLVDRVGGIGPGNAARFSQAGLTVGGTGWDAQAAAAAKPAKARNTSQTEGSSADGKAPRKPKADPAV